MGQSLTKRISLQCPRCGSHDSQTRDVAWAQSHRRTVGGHDSVSAFGASVAPPPRRSVFWTPLGTAIGFGCSALFVAAAVISRFTDLGSTLLAVYDPRAVWTAVIVGAVCFGIRSMSAVAHNETVWPRLYDEWSAGAVCRRCGHQFRLTSSSSRTEGRENE